MPLLQAPPKGGPIVRPGLTSDQIALIKRTICKDATDDELALFVAQCNRTGLDPFARQIYAVKRWDWKAGREVMSIQTGIDGLRLIAERTGEYDGQDDPEWKARGKDWTEIWEDEGPPFAARVRVYRKGVPRAFSGIAKYEAYVQRIKKDNNKPNEFWTRMPDHMLSKVAEALAIRKAFPMECSGIYTKEEMGEAEIEGNLPVEPATEKRAEPRKTFRIPLPESAAPNPGQVVVQEGTATTTDTATEAVDTAAEAAAVRDEASTEVAALANAIATKINDPEATAIKYVTKGQAANLHRDFRREIQNTNASQYNFADKHFYGYMLENGYYAADINPETGEEERIPSADLVPADHFAQVKMELLQLARNCK